MKVLVTGGGGFLGRYIVDLARSRGREVRVIGRTPQPELATQGVEVVQGDLGVRGDVMAACAGVDAVFHVAAKAGVWGSWDSFYRPNVLGTRNVLDSCRENKVRYLVHTSTPSVVFSPGHLSGVDERTPYGTRWLCHYPHTKAIAEKEVLEANNGSLHTVALRPHLIWGPRDPHLVPRVVERARAGRLRIVGHGTNRVDLTHVTNAAHAHLLALDALMRGNARGKAYFISDGQPVVLWDWINDLLQRLDIPPVTRHVSSGAAYAAGAVFEVLWRTLHLRGEPPMTRFVAVELAKDHFFDISAARRDLGYAPVIDPERALAELVEQMRKPAR